MNTPVKYDITAQRFNKRYIVNIDKESMTLRFTYQQGADKIISFKRGDTLQMSYANKQNVTCVDGVVIVDYKYTLDEEEFKNNNILILLVKNIKGGTEFDINFDKIYGLNMLVQASDSAEATEWSNVTTIHNNNQAKNADQNIAQLQQQGKLNNLRLDSLEKTVVMDTEDIVNIWKSIEENGGE